MSLETLPQIPSEKEQYSQDPISVQASFDQMMDRYSDGDVLGELAGNIEPFKDAETAQAWVMQSANKLGDRTTTRIYKDGLKVSEDGGSYHAKISDDLRLHGIDISTKSVSREKPFRPRDDESPFYESDRSHTMKLQDDAGGEYTFSGKNRYDMDRSRAASVYDSRKPDVSETQITYTTNKGEETEFSQTARMSSTHESSEQEQALYATLASGLKESLESKLARIDDGYLDKVEGDPVKEKGRLRRAVGQKALSVVIAKRKMMYKIRGR